MDHQTLRSPALRTFSIARSSLYFAEALPLTLLSAFLTGRKREDFISPEKLEALWQEITRLHNEDIKNIEQGFYPAEVLKPSWPSKHILNLLRVWKDAMQVAWRMRQNKHNEFESEAQQLLLDLPEYYKRNFHFQTDGYMSEASAQLYDHQVDVLFSGSAGAMRRMIIPPIWPLLNRHPRGSILDLGCGPASATVYLAQAFPKAKITGIDLSSPYVKEAQKRLRHFPHANAINADAAGLPFKNNSFDAITCVFMFHELPHSVRLDVLREAKRVLKPGGTLVVADSIQWNDNVTLNWALERFPIDYHEPFYTNYIRTPLKGLFEECGFIDVSESYRFLTKVVSGSKSSDRKETMAEDI
jgi:ubiquinone/menaquinone biosynthesis C-methylase UbiE